MIGKLTLAAGLLAAGTLMTAPGASATPTLNMSLAPGIEADSGLVQQITHRHHHHFFFHRHRHPRVVLLYGPQVYGYRYYGRCRYWRHECARRWGWGTRRYYRCLWRHGC
jgi:hypothetical protein